MTVYEALKARKSTRAFLDRDVDRQVILSILDGARQAPSGANHQPWQVAVVSGRKKLEIQEKMVSAFRAGEKPEMDYHYYPVKWPEPYKTRRMECGLQLYSSLGIERRDKERRLDQWVANYRAFDAPVVLFFFLETGLEAGSFMDYGMFLQSIMLAAVEEGLATCPQAALGGYPTIVKEALGYPDNSILLCGMALGYEDRSAPINGYRTPRETAEAFTRFIE